MLARKCDVCKSIYEHYDGYRLFSKKDGLNESNAIMMIDRDIKNDYWRRKTYDLCPKCMEKIEQFLKADEKIEDVNMFQLGYNKAVDDFVKTMKLWADNIEKIRNSEAFFTIHDIECHAKLLKEQDK